MTQISVIGLGVMGSTLANTLLQNGYSVTVWNRTVAKTKPLPSGAIVASSAEEPIIASPATITCIASHEQTVSLLH